MTMRKTKQQWVLSWIAGASIVLSLAGVTHAQNQPDPNQVLSEPLSQQDPRAKLDSSLLNVPAMPMPVEGSSPTVISSQSSAREVGYDLKTGSSQLGPLRSLNLVPSENFSLSNLGGNASIKPEPRVSTPPTGHQIKPSTVLGTDDRTRISDTTAYPWRAMTKLYMTYPNGKKFMCSGALISAKYVLTAGHCIYDASQGGWASQVEVIPGLNGTYKPYGSAFATYMRSYTGWLNSSDPNYDFALLTLDKTIGNTTGWLGYGYFPSINGVSSNLGGYPGDRDNGLSLFYHYGSVSSSTTQRASYPIDTAGGQSGSGVYRFYDFGGGSQRYVFAVHTNGGSTANSGTRIDSQKFNDLQAWISSNF